MRRQTRPQFHSFFPSLSWWAFFSSCLRARAQSGNAGTVRGAVTDPTGAVIPGATVHLSNAVSGLDRTAATNATGQFEFANVPFNNYQVNVTANGFGSLRQNSLYSRWWATNLKLVLQVAAADSTVTVEASSGDLIRRSHVPPPTWTATCYQGAAGGASPLRSVRPASPSSTPRCLG